MKDHSGCRRAFHWCTKAYYHQPNRQPEVMFGMFHSDGSTSGEMAMRWKSLGGKLVPQLQVFNDAWSVLASFPDLIERLGDLDNEVITEEEFVKLLLDCGFEDITQYESPYGQRHEEILRRELTEVVNRAKEIRRQLANTKE